MKSRDRALSRLKAISLISLFLLIVVIGGSGVFLLIDDSRGHDISPSVIIVGVIALVAIFTLWVLHNQTLQSICRINNESQEANAQLKAVIKNYSGVIWNVDREGIITMFDGRYLDVIGVTPAFLEGKSIELARLKNRHLDVIEYVGRALQGEPQDWIGEIDGSMFRSRVSPVYEGEEIVGVMGSTDDLTDMVRLQEELQEALAKAEAASKAKSEFLSNTSHEMRTPLNAIIGMARVGHRDDDCERKDYALAKIETAGAHLLGIINDILDISQIEAGRLELVSTPFSPAVTLNNAAGLMASRLQEKSQKFEVDVDPSLPTTLLGDRQKFSQIVSNLLSNAIKFTPEGGEVILRATNDGDDENGLCRLTCVIEDTGPGISAEQMPRLFDAFEQADNSSSREFGGLGLGLAISKRIANMMGGDIVASSAQEGGAVFAVTVRFAYPKSAEVATDAGVADGADTGVADAAAGYAGTAAAGGETPDFAAYRILLAEDLEVNREIVSLLLEPTGLSIEFVENGSEAVQRFQESYDRYDLILMDMQMPTMDGLEATRRIRALAGEDHPCAEKARHIPIVAMTANVFQEDVDNCKAAGMDDHLGKPLELKRVHQLLAQYLKAE